MFWNKKWKDGGKAGKLVGVLCLMKGFSFVVLIFDLVSGFSVFYRFLGVDELCFV